MCKKLIYLVSFVLVLGLVLSSGAGAADTNLVAWWKFDEGSGTIAKDSSGNGHDGTLLLGPQWVAGKLGGALEFSGTSGQRVEMEGYDGILGTQNRSVMAWVKTTGFGDWISWGQNTDTQKWIGRINDNAGNGAVGALRTECSGGYIISTTVVNDGEWHHLAAVLESPGSPTVEDIKMYVDGVQETISNVNPVGIDTVGGRNVWIADGHHDRPLPSLIDDVRLYDHAMTQAEIQQAMIGVPPGAASNPSPADEATDVPRDVVLGWTPGEFAPPTNGHTVYFGENFNDVNDGIGGIAQDADSYTPPQRLEFNTTYYWRVDEVNGPPDFTVYQGDVWSFTTEPVGYPIENITATASSSNQADTGPENTINGSGLDANDLHSKETTDMWLSSVEPLGAWIEFQFDKVYKMHEMWVWNSNQMIESALGFGLKDVSIEYSVDGTEYTPLGTTAEFARAPGMPDYAHNTTVDFGGVTAKHIRLTANSNWGGVLPQYGLSEVRFFHIPVRAREPNPDSGATDVGVDVVLSFRAGREAAEHDVYFGSDEQAVIDSNVPAATVTETSYGPLSLDLAQTYYWKVSEVNIAESPTTWDGDVWNFTTRKFLIVDDFESYNDLDPADPESRRIFNVWIDGYGDATNGSLVGYENPPFCEQTIVHGGKQSMPFFYSNTDGAASSEATLTLSPAQDWTAGGATTLSLWFFGDPNNTAAQMYVKVNGTKVAYDGNPGNLALPSWQVWNIDLASVGTNLQNVTTVSIGIDGNGASGKLLFDDIKLYRLAPAPVNEWSIAAGSDDAEEHVLDAGTMEALDSSDLELGYEGAMAPAGLQTIGCRWMGVPVPKGATITEAWVQFSADDINNDYHIPDVSLIIEGQLSPNPATFSSTAGDISIRPTTTAQVVWDIPQWMTVHAKGPEERTPDISSIIQEIVNQDGWAGNAIVLMFRDNPAKPSAGTREAESFDGSANEAPLLHISYQ